MRQKLKRKKVRNFQLDIAFRHNFRTKREKLRLICDVKQFLLTVYVKNGLNLARWSIHAYITVL